MTRAQFISFSFFALLVFIVYQVGLLFLPFFKAIFWSAILTFAFYPMHEKLKQTLKGHDALPAALMTLVVFVAVILPLSVLVVNLAAQAIELYQATLTYIRQGQLEALIDQFRHTALIRHAEERLGEWTFVKEHASDWLLSSARNIGNFAATQAGTITRNVFFVVVNICFMLFLLFVFFKDGRQIYDYIYQVAPLEEKNKAAIFHKINETFGAVIRGQLLTSFTQSVVAGTVFWILGLPLPVFFAILTFITALIPVVGASAVWIPLAVYLATHDAMSKAIMLTVFGLLVISLIDNVMKPALIGEKTRLPYFLLFFGILGGLKVYGLMGIFVAPVVLSLFFSLIKIYQEKNQ